MDTVKLDKKNKIIKDAEKIKDAGSSDAQAFSLSLKANNANDVSTMKKYYSNDVDNNADISIGSFVKLISDNTGKKYEVININNKGDVELRDTSSNAVISKSKQDLLPIIMENDMEKINEAQYTVSINNLETQDADTLSQMLSLASQAEGNSGDGLEVVDASTVEMGMDEPSDFVDPELDADVPPSEPELNAYANPEMGDTAVVPVEPEVDTDQAFEVSDVPPENNDELIESKETPVEDDTEVNVPEGTVKVKVRNIQWDCDGDDPEEAGLPSEIELEVVHNDGASLDDEVSDELSDTTGYCHNGFEYSIVEDNVEESKEEPTDEEPKSYIVYEFTGDMCQGSKEAKTWDEAEKIALDLHNNGSDAIVAGVNANGEEIDLGEKGEFIGNVETKDADTKIEVPADNEDKKLLNEEEPKDSSNRFKEFGEDSFYELWTLKSENPELYNYYIKSMSNEERKEWDNWLKTKKPTEKDVRISHFDDNIDEQIAETLRLAGVKLDEEAVKNAVPEIVDEKTLIANKKDLETGKESGEEQRPNYQTVKTEDTWGKDSSKGMPRCSMKLKEMVNMNKIKAICETANHMYHKKDKSEWLFLDRRYIEKLMKEGVSYSNASKMLLIAKK